MTSSRHPRDLTSAAICLLMTMAVMTIVATSAQLASATAIDPVIPSPPGGSDLSIDSLRPDALALRVGIVGSYWQADSPANVNVYADGRVIVTDPDEHLGYSTFVLTPTAVDELLELAGDATPFDDVDYGEAEVTDVGSTRVEVHADQGDAVIEVWALDHMDGLTADQRTNRERLIDLVAALEGLAGETTVHAEPLVAYTSNEVVVRVRPVLPGMGPDHEAVPWPLAEAPTDIFSDVGYHYVCMSVPSSSVAGLPDEIDGERLWAPPDDLGVLTPDVVAASASSVLPGEKPCESFTPVEPIRPLAPAELAAPPHDWTSPWEQGTRTTTHPFEEWMAVDAVARTVLPSELGGDWDWDRWSWFDYRFAAADVAGRRVIDFHATCTEFVTDEEPACTIAARFDAATGELLEFSAS